MKRAAATLGLAMLLAACDDESKPVRRPQGLLPGEEVPKGPPPQALPEEKPAAGPPRSLPSPFAQPKLDPGALAKPAEPAPEEPSPEAGPTRDLPAELATRLGQPSTCLDLAAVERAGGRITVSVTAYVVPSGRVTRASALAPGQPAEALRCLEQRATQAHLPGAVPGAPTQVTASFPIEVVVQRDAPR